MSDATRWAGAGARALPILALLAIGLLNLHQAGAPQDEGAILVYADRVLHGAVAHRDFLTFYGPGMPWLLGGLFFITGPSIIVERLLALVVALTVALLVTRLAKRWGTGPAAAAGALASVSLIQLPPYASPWLAAVALILASLAVTTTATGRSQPAWCFALAGLLAALAVTFRIDIAPAIALAALPLLWRRVRMVAWYAAGAAAGLVPLGVHVLVATPAAVFQNVFVDAVLRQSPARHLPLPPVDQTTAIELAGVILAVAVNVLASVVAHRRAPGAPCTRLLQALTALSIGLLPEMLQRADAVHVFYAACVCAGVVPISLSVLLRAWGLHIARIAAPASYVACIATILVSAAPQGLAVTASGREFFVAEAEYTDTHAMLAYVARIARGGQRLFVGPADMRRTNYTASYLYFLLSKLVPSTYYLEMEPLTANRNDSRLAADVASADVLVLTTEWDAWSEPNSSSLLGSGAPNAVVERSFCLRASDGVYRVYTRCAAA
jgi:hypothetical protein